MVRVAVIGSGPAGVYAAAALAAHGDVSVDVLDQLPCPFGLVRYGVAPDHPKIKSISSTLAAVLEDPAVRFLGNIEVGADLTLAELHEHYDAVVFSYGAAVDRRLGVPGEDLPGSYSATDFVRWYCGHPDAPLERFTLAARSIAVIGMGNVAVDVARILAKTSDELRGTDVPAPVLDVLERSQAEDIHMLGRRGPAQAKFTTVELRELGQLAHADVVVRPDELELDDASRELLATKPALRRNYEELQAWADRPLVGHPRRIHLRFCQRPVAVLGDDAVTGLRLERTRLDATGGARGTGEMVDLDVQMVLRSVGYRGVPVPGLPFDEASGTVPNRGGRVVDGDAVVAGDYVAGWIKRGPTGVIGTNKHDANETVQALLEDAPTLPPAPVRDPEAILDLLAARGVEVVTWQGWRAIEAAEVELGRGQGRDRVKITDRGDLLRAAQGGRLSV